MFFLQIQFCIAFLHSLQLLWNDCGYPRWSIFFTLPNAIFFYFLFNDFYQKTFNNKEEAKGKKVLADNNGNFNGAVKANGVSLEVKNK